MASEDVHRFAALHAVFSSAPAATFGGRRINLHNAATAPPGTKTIGLHDYCHLLLARNDDGLEDHHKRVFDGIDDIAVELEEFCDPQWDWDYTNLHDEPNSFSRAGENYARPCGWKRYALNVGKMFGSDERWLGDTGSLDSGEWPVSYHGTKKEFVDKIVENGYKTGWNNVYGRGVYSTPDVARAGRYATEYEVDGEKYKAVLQNRINPEHREKHNDDLYWVIPEGYDMKANIRPYGILTKKC